MDQLTIQVIEEGVKKKTKLPPLMDALGIKHPMSMCFVGVSGSGKSTLLSNFVMRYYKGYWDQVYVIASTSKQDDTYKAFGLPDNQLIDTDLIKNLKTIIKNQEDDSKKRVLIILEDSTSQKKLQRSKAFCKAFVQNRHLNISTFVCVHKLNALNRTCKLNSTHLFIFPINRSERQQLFDQFATSNWTKKSFFEMLNMVYTPSDTDQRPFLWINNRASPKDRFRQNLKRIMSTS